MFNENSGEWLNLQVSVGYKCLNIRIEVGVGDTYFRVKMFPRKVGQMQGDVEVVA